MGVEATNQETLDLYNKDLKVADSKRAIDLINANDMVSETSFVIGTPDETPESIKRTLDLAKWYGPDMAFFLAITPWPYADIAKELDSRVTTRNYRKYNLVEPIVKPDAMEIDELRKAMHRCAGEFFHDKFKRLDEMTPQKKAFMVEVLKVLVEHSYLSHDMHKMASGGEMPAAVKAMLATLGRSHHVHH